MKVSKYQQGMKRIMKDFEDLQVFTDEEKRKFIENYVRAQNMYEKLPNFSYLIGAGLVSLSILPISILLIKKIGIPPQFSLLPTAIPFALFFLYPLINIDKYQNYARRIHITADLHRISVERGDIEEAKERLEKQYNLATIFRKSSFEEFREKYSLSELVRRFPC